MNGRTVVTTAGTRQNLGGERPNAPVAVKALAGNSGIVYVGNSNVSSANGFELSAGEVIIFDTVRHMQSIYVDAASNGDGVCWLILST